VIRRFELILRYSSWKVGAKVSELLFIRKYNSKLKDRILFWARLMCFSLDTCWFCRYVLVKVFWNTSGSNSSILLFERSRCCSCSSPRND
jgi:hypothetical protein